MGKLDIHKQEIIKLYKDGVSVYDIADKFGVSRTPVMPILYEAGVYKQRQPITSEDDEWILSEYLSGKSAYSISNNSRFPRQYITNLVRARGIHRSHSEAGLEKNRHMTFSQRQEQTKEANKAALGSKQSRESKLKRAITVEKIGKLQGDYEKRLFTVLKDEFKVTPQKAIDIYNIDFYLEEHNISIEIFGGNWHTTPKHVKLFNNKNSNLVDVLDKTFIVWVGRKGMNESMLVDSIKDKIKLDRKNIVLDGWGNITDKNSKHIKYL